MSTNPNDGDRAYAENVWKALADDWRDPIGVLAEALADARLRGASDVLGRLGPIIADAEFARAEIADEVWQ